MSGVLQFIWDNFACTVLLWSYVAYFSVISVLCIFSCVFLYLCVYVCALCVCDMLPCWRNKRWLSWRSWKGCNFLAHPDCDRVKVIDRIRESHRMECNGHRCIKMWYTSVKNMTIRWTETEVTLRKIRVNFSQGSDMLIFSSKCQRSKTLNVKKRTVAYMSVLGVPTSVSVWFPSCLLFCYPSGRLFTLADAESSKETAQ